MKYLFSFLSIVYSLVGLAQDRSPEGLIRKVSERESDVKENDRRKDKNSSRVEFERMNKIKNVESVRALNCGIGGSTLSK